MLTAAHERFIFMREGDAPPEAAAQRVQHGCLVHARAKRTPASPHSTPCQEKEPRLFGNGTDPLLASETLLWVSERCHVILFPSEKPPLGRI